MRQPSQFVAATVPGSACALTRIDFILFYKAWIMKNIVCGVIFDIYAILAALCSFRLLFRRRTRLALPSPERVLAFEQGSLLFDGRAFPCRLNPPKPGLPWGARSDLRLAYFGRGSGAGLVVSSQVRRLDTDILFKRRNSNAGGGHSPDHDLPWHRSNSAGPGVVLRKRVWRSNQLRSARRVLKGRTLQHERARYRSASLVGRDLLGFKTLQNSLEWVPDPDKR